MDTTGSRSGYDSSDDKTMGQSKKQSGQLIHDQKMEEEGEAEIARAQATEDEMMAPATRLRAAENQKDKADK
jgi:uncharacterized protein YjbJ (UPF0337 family)